MSTYIKKSTLMRGLPVSKLPHRALGIIYSKTLHALSRLPENSAYRVYTEKIINDRVDIVKNVSKPNFPQTPDVPELEKKINCGQVEELIMQAESELLLARKMSVWKPWESPISQAPENQWTWPPHK